MRVSASSLRQIPTVECGFQPLPQKMSGVLIIDLGGNVRSGDKTENVFGIKLGVAISFMIKQSVSAPKQPCRIYYSDLSTSETVEQKLNFLSSSKISDIVFTHIVPSKDNSWVHAADNDFDSLIPIYDKESKLSSNSEDKRLFGICSNGLSTNRDEWTYDINKLTLENKIQFFIAMVRTIFDRKAIYRIGCPYNPRGPDK